MNPETLAELESWAKAHAPHGSVQALQVLELIAVYWLHKGLIVGLAERVAKQSDLLSKRAERQ